MGYKAPQKQQNGGAGFPKIRIQPRTESSASSLYIDIVRRLLALWSELGRSGYLS
jgi:hypothetical protein